MYVVAPWEILHAAVLFSPKVGGVGVARARWEYWMAFCTPKMFKPR